MKTLLPLLSAVVLSSAFAWSQTTATSPTTAPASGPATTPATQATVPTSPEAVKILDALEKAGLKHKTIKADLTYEVAANSALGENDKEIRTGYVLYWKDKPEDIARFRITFDSLRQGNGPAVGEEVDYVFGPDDNGSLWLSIAEHSNKKLRQVQVAPAGAKVNPLQIGKGPFPLPFGQKTRDVLACCDVVTRQPQTTDPKDTDYLKLVPRPGKDLNFTVLEMWVDRKLDLPVKVVSTEGKKTVTTVVFDKIKINDKTDPSKFKLARPLGWTVDSTPLK